MHDLKFPMPIVHGCINGSSLVIEFIFKTEEKASSSSEPDGIKNGGVSKIILLIGITFWNKPSCSLHIIGFYCIMQGSSSIIIKREIDLFILKNLLKRNELCGQ